MRKIRELPTHCSLNRLTKFNSYIEKFLFVTADKEVIEAKERESPKRAAGLLLDQIIASDELGKWTTFISALKTVGRYFIRIRIVYWCNAKMTISHQGKAY